MPRLFVSPPHASALPSHGPLPAQSADPAVRDLSPSLARIVPEHLPRDLLQPDSAPSEAAVGASPVLAPAWAPLPAHRVGLRDSAGHHPVWSSAPQPLAPCSPHFTSSSFSKLQSHSLALRSREAPEWLRQKVPLTRPPAVAPATRSPGPSRVPAWSLLGLSPSHLICSPRSPPGPESRPDGPFPAPRCALPGLCTAGTRHFLTGWSQGKPAGKPERKHSG